MQRFIFFILFFIFIFHCSYVCSSGVCKSDSCRFIKGGDKTIKQKRWLSFKRIESGHLINQNDDLCQILSQPNCRFIVRSDFDLKGLTIHVGNNSVLVFNGGSLNNGYLIFDNNLLENPSDNCINNCKCKGLLQNDYLKPEWFGAKGDGIHDDYYALKATFTLTNRAVLGIKKHYQINTIPEEHKRESSVYTFFEIEKNLVVEGNHSTIEVRRSSLSNIKHRPYINRIIFLPLADYFTISDLNVVINRDISDIYSRENNIYDGGINYIYAMCPHLSVSNSTLINNGEYNNVTFCFAQTALKHVIDHCVFFDNSLSYAGGFYWLMEVIMVEGSGQHSAAIKNIYNIIREDQIPYFDDPYESIAFYFKKNGFDVNATIYELLILKSESSTISVSGLSTQDTSGYFKRLASKYKPFNSHIMSGG